MFDKIKKLFNGKSHHSTTNKDISTNNESNVSQDVSIIEELEANDPVNDTDMLWELLDHEKYNEVISQAKTLLNSKSSAIVKEAHTLTGMAFFRQGMFQEALTHYQKATEYQPEVGDWFNIITSATLAKKIDIGRDAFNKAMQLQIDTGHEQQPSIPYIHLYYAYALRDASEFELAFEQINCLREIYEQLNITDTTFLHLRGVPFLSNTMELALDIFNGLGNSVNAQEWIKDFATKLDEDGQAYLAEVSHKIKAT